MQAQQSQKVTFFDFNPPWEGDDSRLWLKQVILFLLCVGFYALFLLVGYTYQGSTLPTLFSGSEGTVHIVEFTAWFVTLFFYVDLVYVAWFKTERDKLAYKQTWTAQSLYHARYNTSFGLGFFIIFLFYIIRLGSNWIWNFDINVANINLSMTLAQTDPSFSYWYTFFAALLVAGGFGAYSQFLFQLERVMLGRKVPVLWVIPIIGIILIIFVPYNSHILTIPFTTGLQLPIDTYYLGMIIAWIGAALVPILYFILSKWYEYENPKFAKESLSQSRGFLLLSLAAFFNLNHDLYFVQGVAPVYGGILFGLEVVFSMFLGPLCNLVGFIMIRRVYKA
jgi:hypothetical protein